MITKNKMLLFTVKVFFTNPCLFIVNVKTNNSFFAVYTVLFVLCSNEVTFCKLTFKIINT